MRILRLQHKIHVLLFIAPRGRQTFLLRGFERSVFSPLPFETCINGIEENTGQKGAKSSDYERIREQILPIDKIKRLGIRSGTGRGTGGGACSGRVAGRFRHRNDNMGEIRIPIPIRHQEGHGVSANFGKLMESVNRRCGVGTSIPEHPKIGERSIPFVRIEMGKKDVLIWSDCGSIIHKLGIRDGIGENGKEIGHNLEIPICIGNQDRERLGTHLSHP